MAAAPRSARHGPVTRDSAHRTVADAPRLPPQRIIRRDFVGIAKRRPRPVLERQAIKAQRNRGAADEGGVVLADQEHGTLVIAGHSRPKDGVASACLLTRQSIFFEGS